MSSTDFDIKEFEREYEEFIYQLKKQQHEKEFIQTKLELNEKLKRLEEQYSELTRRIEQQEKQYADTISKLTSNYDTVTKQLLELKKVLSESETKKPDTGTKPKFKLVPAAGGFVKKKK